jgi:hypothetical protein
MLFLIAEVSMQATEGAEVTQRGTEKNSLKGSLCISSKPLRFSVKLNRFRPQRAQRSHREEFSEKLSVNLSETSAVLCEAESLLVEQDRGQKNR